MFSCDEKKNVSVCDRRKPNSCNPKNDFDRDFSAKALCIMVIMKLHPLFIYIMYMYVQKRYFPLWSQPGKDQGFLTELIVIFLYKEANILLCHYGIA